MADEASRAIADAIIEEAKLEGTTTANTTLESTILGVCTRDTLALDTAREILKKQDFTGKDSAVLWAVIIHLNGQGISVNPVTIQAEMEARNCWKQFGGSERLRGYLDDLSGKPEEILSYIRQLRNFTVARVQRKVSLKLDRESKTVRTPDERLSKTKNLIAELEGYVIRNDRSETLGDVVARVGIEKFLNPRFGETFIETPWERFNDLIIGYRPQTLNIVGALTSHGKSTFAANICMHAARAHIPCAFFSLEMLSEDVYRRCCCSLAGVSSMRFAKGQLDEDERRRIAVAVQTISTWPLRIANLQGYTVNDIEAEIRALKAEDESPSLVIVDHIHKMRPVGKSVTLRESHVQISQDMGAMARKKDLDICILALAQLRKQERGVKKRPTIEDIREANNWAEEASTVAIIHRPEFYQEDGDKSKTVVFLDKNRGGPVGHFPLKSEDKFFRFVDEV